MPLSDFTFRLGDSGVVLNSDPTFPFVDVDRVSGLDSAPFREAERDHEGTDGGFMDAEFEKGRNLTVEGFVYGASSNMETYLDSLKANYAPSTISIPFYFKSPGVSERLLFVKPRGCRYDWDSFRRTETARVQFSMFAEDPRIYDSTLQSFSLELGGTTTEGFGFDLGFSFGFGSTSQTGEGLTVTNVGNRPTPAIFTFNGPVTNPEIRNDTVSKSLRFIITLASTDTLEVNLATHTVRLNGTANRRGSLQQANWFFLEPGGNFLRYHAGSSAASTVDIEFRSAWR